MTKRALPRKSISEEGFYAGERYYSAADVRQIIAVVPALKTLGDEAVLKRLEYIADWYCLLAHSNAEFDEAPSVSNRRFKRWGDLLQDVLVVAKSLPPASQANLESAAEIIAKRSRCLPDFEPEAIPIDPIPGIPNSANTITYWPVQQQLQKVFSEITWLHDVILEAQRNTLEQVADTGGNRPAEAKKYFCRMLHELLSEAGVAGELSASTDRITDETIGPLADFLERAFAPLGIKDSRSTLVRYYQRTVAEISSIRSERIKRSRKKRTEHC